MVELIWTEPALGDLDAIADYIALDNPDAAKSLVRRVIRHVDQLKTHPESGSVPPELRGKPYRQIVEPPCRVIYRLQARRIVILHVMRGEMLLRVSKLLRRDKKETSAD